MTQTQPVPPDLPIALVLPAADVQKVLVALGNLPHNTVHTLIQSIEAQANIAAGRFHQAKEIQHPVAEEPAPESSANS